MITVPACAHHNKALQADEEYFRTYLSMVAFPSPLARQLWDGPIQRQFQRSPSFRNLFASNLKETDLLSPGGVYLRTADALHPDGARIARVLEKIIRGLTWEHRRSRFGDIELQGQLLQAAMQTSLPDLSHIPFTGPFEVGHVVTYGYAFAHDDPDYSIWIFRFYGKAIIPVGTGKRGLF